ncbi:MAG TPA: porin [Pasteurellaceae bacterium]|nr:porin [Pasteurellaceae bacterium]
MKKTLLAVAIGALAITSTASANWYVQGDLGYSKIKASGMDDLDFKDNVFDQRISAGYDFGNIRLALDYSHIGKAKDSYTVYRGMAWEASGSTSVETNAFGVSAFYDFDLKSALTPYIGIRLSENRLKFEDNWADNSGSFNYSESKTKFGYGVLAGVQYNLADNLLLNAGIEYNHLGKIEDVKVHQYSAKVGLRYSF